jgi:hypothetical protein
MKKIILLFFLVSVLFVSCQQKQNQSYIKASENLNRVIEEINTKFPGNPAFHSLMISFDELMGNTVLLKMASVPDSAMVQEWLFMNGMWDMISENILETDSINFNDLVFSSGIDYDLSKLSAILASASEKAEVEKNIDLYQFTSINLLMAKEAYQKSKMDNLIIQVTIQSVKDKKNYLINFDANGNFTSITEEITQ